MLIYNLLHKSNVMAYENYLNCYMSFRNNFMFARKNMCLWLKAICVRFYICVVRVRNFLGLASRLQICMITAILTGSKVIDMYSKYVMHWRRRATISSIRVMHLFTFKWIALQSAHHHNNNEIFFFSFTLKQEHNS